jgi:dTDP-4-dehydro-6-deoxy-alpha-D-glucopyranose 2,3-dehydratase
LTLINLPSTNQKPKRLKSHNSKALEFLISALSEQNPFMDVSQFSDWFDARRSAHHFRIEEIPFQKLESWSFESSTGNLRHASGKFFSIEGIWVETNAGPLRQWSQPIINQPEIGILGILAKKFNGVLHFLMQAKMEPGNIDFVQLGPTVQATRSNYTLAHKGNTPPYLEYFLDKSDSTILVDSLQSEQGARFLFKRNRNIIIETIREVEMLEDYCWLTLGQIHKLMKRDNTVNMDARSVLSCISFGAPELENKNTSELTSFLQSLDSTESDIFSGGPDDFYSRVLASAVNCDGALYDSEDIISWFTELKVHYELKVERIPLKFVKNWHITPTQIVHDKEKYFSIIAVAVQAGNREVTHWTQPVVKPQKAGLVAYIAKSINGVLHFLLQAKVEPGNFDIIEMAPTVQCITDSYEFDAPEERPAFLDYILSASPNQIRSSTLQSEEGGRFFQESNRYMIVEVGDDFPLEVPNNFIWITLGQIKEFVKYNNYVNVEGRCLLSLLRFMQ